MTAWTVVALADLPERPWRDFVAAQGDAWFTHDPYWCRHVDGPTGVDVGFAVLDAAGRVGAIVPGTVLRSGAVVSGVNEPSGPLLGDVEPGDRADLWDLIDRRLTEDARRHDTDVVGLKFPVLTRAGHRPPDHVDAPHLARLGYREDVRRFFRMNLDRPEADLWDGVSSRMRSQIRAAERACEVRQAAEDADIAALLDVYTRHAAAKGNPVPVTAEDLRTLVDGRTPVGTLALLGHVGGEPAGFALSFGVGDCATLFAWGCVPEAGRSQLQKLMVWRSLTLLREQGVSHVEYGGAIDGVDRFAGLTEFYRRVGGDVLESLWAYKRVEPATVTG